VRGWVSVFDPEHENGTVDSPQCPACGVALRVCPACGSVIAASTGRGRPRVYCSDACRWRHGHRAARQRARAASAAWMDGLVGDLAVPGWPG
jgi:hypothetical protein